MPQGGRENTWRHRPVTRHLVRLTALALRAAPSSATVALITTAGILTLPCTAPTCRQANSPWPPW
ncbi:hypothetical protein QFZ32_000748 [Streptomyces canus]|nr:hypothetical protein [Streptomyces canus]MDQ1065308.1 hypothetical protein [Streptomyces canus]